MACQLLGFKSSELQKLTLEDFVLDPENGRGIEAIAETEILADAINGKVLVAGKVVSSSRELQLHTTQYILLPHMLQMHLLFTYSNFLKVDVQTKNGGIVTMSLWLKETQHNRKLAILEPVDRSVANVSPLLIHESIGVSHVISLNAVFIHFCHEFRLCGKSIDTSIFLHDFSAFPLYF